MSGKSGNIVNYARKLDDFIIDRLLQPAINQAQWLFGLTQHRLARFCTILGAGLGLIWVHRYDAIFSANFWQDLVCLVIMTVAAFAQIRTHEASAPRRATLAPAVRLTGLLWRTLWLTVLVLFPTQWPVEAHGELLGSFLWTLLLVLPYWLICCRLAPPPAPRHAHGLRYATITVR